MGQNNRFYALDSLRGICACMVALYHLPSTSIIVNTPFVRSGWMFVDFFFVLSGFVISLSYLGRLSEGYSLRRFMLLRLGRIYPLHIAMLAVLFLFQMIMNAGDSGAANHDISALFGSAFLVNIFGFWPNLTWNIPSWSISAELWAYLLFAIAVRFSGRYLHHVLGLTVLASVLLLAVHGDSYLNRTFSFSLVRCSLGFSLGVIAFQIHRQISARWPVLDYKLATALEFTAIAACIFLLPILSKPMTLVAPFLFCGTVLVFARQEGGISRFLMLAPFVGLGTLSYSIYMTHLFVEGRMRNVVQVLEKIFHRDMFVNVTAEGGTYPMIALPGIWNELIAVGVLVPIIAVSNLTWRFVEEPGRRMSRRWIERSEERLSAAQRERLART